MSSLSNNNQNHEVALITVPFPAQGHLNQLLQLSSLVSSYNIPVYYIGSGLSNRQAKARINGLNPQDVEKIHFHDIPIPSFESPGPDPNSTHKFPSQLQPAWEASLSLRQPVAAYLHDMAQKFRRVIVVHDLMMSFVVQDVVSIKNAESYIFNCVSAISLLAFSCQGKGLPFPIKHPRELASVHECIPEQAQYFGAVHVEPMKYRAGDLHNTCRLIEAPYLEVLETEEFNGKKSWAIGPILPTKLTSHEQHKCLEWLDKHEPQSVIYISFGTTVSLSDEQIKELACGLEKSGVKFLWVLRDADKGDVFDEDVRRAELPEGFEERLQGVGMVVRDWAPQPQILAHASTGAFMTHCGWNSSIESITLGVAMAAWPMHSDQPINSSFITDILKTGLVVGEWTERLEVVKASTIENVVRRLMASDEGAEIRKRAGELGASLRPATQPGGTSRLELDSFIAYITR